MKEKNIILTARIASMVFTPFYLPIVGLLALFIFSYLGLLPWSYKFTVLALVYAFTILLPTLLIHLYRTYQGWSLIELGVKERSIVLFWLLLHNEHISYTSFYGWNTCSSTIDTTDMCHNKRMVENISTCSSNRWSRRSIIGICSNIRF